MHTVQASTREATTECTTNNQELATVSYRGRQFQVPVGTKLRTALLRDGRVSPHNGQAQLINCRGIGSCGTCAVEIRYVVQCCACAPDCTTGALCLSARSIPVRCARLLTVVCVYSVCQLQFA